MNRAMHIVLRMSLMLRTLCVGTFLALSATAIAAQDSASPQRTQWDALADRAADVLEDDDASAEMLSRMRDRLAAQRTEALERAERGSVRAQSLSAQIEALVPRPEDVPEPGPVAERRAQLETALAEANAPVLDARAAYQRADLLIARIDGRLREQEAARLIERMPSPLVPSAWASLADDLGARQPAEGEPSELVEDLPTLAAWSTGLMIFAMAVGLIFVAEPLVTAVLVRARQRSLSRSRRRAIAAATLVLRLLIPGLGLVLIFVAPAALVIEFPGHSALVGAIAAAAFGLATAHVLGHVLFAPKRSALRVFDLDDAMARRGYGLSLLLGLFLAVDALIGGLEQEIAFSPASQSVLALIVVVLGAFPVFRLGTFLRRLGATARDGTEVVDDLRRLFERFVQVAAILAVLAALVGYVNLARYALEPTVLTIGLVALVLFLRALLVGVLVDGLGQTTSDEEEAAVLIPVVVSVLLSFAALPVLAVIWGASRRDLSEAWRVVTSGVRVGDATLSLTSVAVLVAVFFVGLLATRFIQRFLGQSILRRSRLDRGVRSSIITGIGYVGITLAALVALSTAGISLASLAVVFGALSVGIGFGLQTVVANFVSGLILLIERPVKEGDWIEVSGHSGYVRKIAVRSTRIETFDRFDVIVPNSDLIAGVVKNMTLTSKEGRLILPVGVAYGSDVALVREILLAAADRRPEVLSMPAPVVLFADLGDSRLEFELRCYLRDVDNLLTARSELLFDIYSRLTEAGIDIPVPQRNLTLVGLDEIGEAIKGLARHG
ncbi:mechanosensitive ion channel protein MscS [Roseivivax marinus]|uniref:Mechanosensitive ion channel protein MscS n=2 Tax=Roseivivax marinus TaxID=1379903 RepID=W4HN00_9RHOB|nr:mechanosensitive ion channel protein MscS [Roseivivax marinus]